MPLLTASKKLYVSNNVQLLRSEARGDSDSIGPALIGASAILVRGVLLPLYRYVQQELGRRYTIGLVHFMCAIIGISASRFSFRTSVRYVGQGIYRFDMVPTFFTWNRYISTSLSALRELFRNLENFCVVWLVWYFMNIFHVSDDAVFSSYKYRT